MEKRKGRKKKRRQTHERKAEAAKLLNGRAQSLRADANG